MDDFFTTHGVVIVVGLVLSVAFFAVCMSLIFVKSAQSKQATAESVEEVARQLRADLHKFTQHLQEQIDGVREDLGQTVGAMRCETAASSADVIQKQFAQQEQLCAVEQQLRAALEAAEQRVGATAASMSASCATMQQELTGYFSDFRGQVSKEVALQFETDNIVPRIALFREETDQQMQKIGEEKIEKHAEKQTELYEKMNGELQKLGAEGALHAEEWGKKQQECQKEVSAHCKQEFTRIQSRIVKHETESKERYGAVLKESNQEKLSDFQKNFKKESSSLVKTCQDMCTGAREVVAVESASARGAVQAAEEIMRIAATRAAQDMQSALQNGQVQVSTVVSEATKECKKMAKALGKDLGDRMTTVEQEMQSCTKKVEENDWWIRDNAKQLWEETKKIRADTGAENKKIWKDTKGIHEKINQMGGQEHWKNEQEHWQK